MITAWEAMDRLRRGEVQIPPLEIRLLELQSSRGRRLDALVRVCWQERCYDFDVEYKSRSTPRYFADAINEALEANGSGTEPYPMVMMPYLSEPELRQLVQREVSGIDLCGNGVVVVSGELLVFRTGGPNRYKDSGPIKNVYRRKSSLAARVFLLRPEYPSVGAIQEEIERRGGKVTLPTVSKVLKRLEEDLIVGRSEGAIRLLQPEKLLDLLASNYQPPNVRRQFVGKVAGPPETLIEMLGGNAGRNGLPLVMTGSGSAASYSVLAESEILPVYCPDVERLLGGIAARETTRFPNLRILATDDETVYFDTRPEGDYPWASPVQTYLELMAGDKRERETAAQVREFILKELRAPLP